MFKKLTAHVLVQQGRGLIKVTVHQSTAVHSQSKLYKWLKNCLAMPLEYVVDFAKIYSAFGLFILFIERNGILGKY